jgi:hypothetical protein
MPCTPGYGFLRGLKFGVSAEAKGFIANAVNVNVSARTEVFITTGRTRDRVILAAPLIPVPLPPGDYSHVFYNGSSTPPPSYLQTYIPGDEKAHVEVRNS